MSLVTTETTDATHNPLRGVQSLAEARQWLNSRGIEDIECMTSDLAGVARGKLMPADKFFSSPVMAMPTSVFTTTITGEYPEEDDAFQHDPNDGDVILKPDYSTLAAVPWASEPTAQIIHDAYHRDGRAFELAPRQLLRRIVSLYEREGWKAVVAPEIEFYLVKQKHRPRLSAGTADRSLRPGRVVASVLFDPACERVRRPVRRHLRLLREAGPRDRHAHPRGRRGTDGDQPASRRPAGAGRSGVPVQTHHPRSGHAPQHVRHLHGQADEPRAGFGHAHPPVGGRHRDGQEHLLRRRGQSDGAVLLLHRRPAEIPAVGDVHPGALCEQLPAPDARNCGPDQRALGL